MGVFIWNLPSLSTRFRKSPKRQSTVTADISANNSLFFAQKEKTNGCLCRFVVNYFVRELPPSS